MIEETIVLTQNEYENIQKRLLWLSCLENAGVDNWQGYDYALELFDSEYNSEKEE